MKSYCTVKSCEWVNNGLCIWCRECPKGYTQISVEDYRRQRYGISAETAKQGTAWLNMAQKLLKWKKNGHVNRYIGVAHRND